METIAISLTLDKMQDLRQVCVIVQEITVQTGYFFKLLIVLQGMDHSYIATACVNRSFV